MAEILKIFCMNVRGLSTKEKRQDTFHWLKQKKMSIYCLTDVHADLHSQSNFSKDWNNSCIFSSYSSESRGVAILFGEDIEYKVLEVDRDNVGNLLMVKLMIIPDFTLWLITLYGPNRDEPDFYENLKMKLSEKENLPLIICGDWNLVQNFKLDTFGYQRENNLKAKKIVSEMQLLLDLEDVWRINHEKSRKYTWFSSKTPRQMARLDFFLTTPDIHSKLKNSAIIPGYRTDHSALTLELQLNNTIRGKGFWKFNTSLLREVDYVNSVKQEIKTTLGLYSENDGFNEDCGNNFTVDYQTLFELLKLNIRGQTIAFSSKKAKDRRREVLNLEHKILALENSLSQVGQEDDILKVTNLYNELHLVKSRLVTLHEPEVKAAILRSKAQCYEEGEKATKFFLNLEKRNYINKTIHRLNVDGQIITDPKEILLAQKNFYKRIYSSKATKSDVNLARFLNKHNVVPLDNASKMYCEGLIKESEALKVIKNMKNNKSPGTDGFPVEFYKFFWADIGKFLLYSFNESLQKGQLSLTQKQSIITCIPKGNKPREFLHNKRPISLLNVDYKILSGILAERLKNVLPEIIRQTQKGFLKNRYIGENIRLVYDIMSELNNRAKTGLILLLDFEKAFDSLEWNYIRKLLKIYNFGENFINCFNTLYSNACSCVINNGIFSEFFNLERGCRQGDPLSPYIFILAIEPLARTILLNPDVKGIKVHDRIFKLGQYADDTFLLLDGSEQSLSTSFEIFNAFSLCSGLKLNCEKTIAVWLGTMSGSKTILCPDFKMTWSNSFNLLGISFHINLETMVDENYSNKCAMIEKILKNYSSRKLSLIGKVTVIKSLAIPKLVYIMTVLPSPPLHIVTRINRMLKNFLWGDKPPRIQTSQLEQDISNGGLKLTNINFLNAALKLSWIPRILDNEGDLSCLFSYTVNYKKQNIWLMDKVSLSKFRQKVSNPFWKDVINEWNIYKTKLEFKVDVRTYPIWDTYFLVNENIVKRKNEFQASNIYFINDLLTETGAIMGFEDFKIKYNIPLNFLDFYTLIHSIPRTWISVLDSYSIKLKKDNISQPILNEICNMKKVCRGTYWNMISLVKVQRNHILKWSEKLQIQLTQEDMSEYYSLNFGCTVESEMRSFQYKILHRVLTTNRFLQLCKIKEDLCYYCNTVPETLEHLFWECPVIAIFWNNLANTLSPYLDLQGALSLTSVLLGVKQVNNSKLINHLINLTKKYIYTTKCIGGVLSTVAIVEKIKYTFRIEQNVVFTFNKDVVVLEKKWNSLIPLILNQRI